MKELEVLIAAPLYHVSFSELAKPFLAKDKDLAQAYCNARNEVIFEFDFKGNRESYDNAILNKDVPIWKVLTKEEYVNTPAFS